MGSEDQTQIPNPLCFVKACTLMGTSHRGTFKIASLSKFRGPPEWCEVRRSAGCCIKSVKKCISHPGAPRGRDAWGALIHIKSYDTYVTRKLARKLVYVGQPRRQLCPYGSRSIV